MTNPLTTPRHPAALVGLLALSVLFAGSAQALPTGETTPGQAQALKCFTGIRASVRTTPAVISLGQSTTLSWTATVPAGCSQIRFSMGGVAVGGAGTVTSQPISNSRYALTARYGSAASSEVAVASVQVVLPPVLYINSGQGNVRWQMAQALATPGQTVVIANNVEMDLTGMSGLTLAAGVRLQGGRTSREPGPRLFTASRPAVLFNVGGDNVRITGVRIEGSEMGVSTQSAPARGIHIDSRVNVEIDNNEISGWSHVGVSIWDGGQRTDPAINPGAIYIHDNFIHHNQHEGSEGYGVAVAYGAYARITRNVFDWNRHAIEGDGRSGTGYEAIGNLVLQHGGLHQWIAFPGTWVHTHQFDMHGGDNCGVWSVVSDSLWNCGRAGGQMVIRQNAFLYTEGRSIKLRGTPEVGMFVGGNVFARPFLLDTVASNGVFFEGAAAQTESGLVIEAGNQTGVDGSAQLGTCDFDGDGVNDSFMATGATWWFSSGGQRPWTYLNTNVAHLSQVQLGYFDGDNVCDVSVGGALYSGGRVNRSTRFGSGVRADVKTVR
jgi:Right handed beta helix region